MNMGMRAYSMDLRDRVVAACDSGGWTPTEVAEEFCVSRAWVYRLLQQRRDRGNYGPKGHRGGRRRAFSGCTLDRLAQLMEQQPDATLEELRQRSGVPCSLTAVFNALKRLDYRRKKRP